MGQDYLVLERSSAEGVRDAIANDYAGVVLSTAEDIHRLGNVARALSRQVNSVVTSEFFLASLSKGWRPKVVAVCSGGEIVGILYARERCISGIPTGVIYADGSLDLILVANPLHRRRAFRVALETLLASPGIRGVRLRLLPESDEADTVREMHAAGLSDSQCYDLNYRDSPLWKYHAHLPLAHTYDHFLKGLGSLTRRNFRHYRARSQAAGYVFVERLSLDELRSATLALLPKSEFTSHWQKMDFEVPLDMVAAAGQPLAVGLRHPNGEWLSVIGGWSNLGRAVLCIQLNNQNDFPNESLSLVLRGYFIEMLIRQGLQELVIWSETGPPLSRYVSYPPTVGARFDVPSYSWRAARRFLANVRPLLPKSLADAAQWIA